jgi:hypothetical protein
MILSNEPAKGQDRAAKVFAHTGVRLHDIIGRYRLIFATPTGSHQVTPTNLVAAEVSNMIDAQERLIDSLVDRSTKPGRLKALDRMVDVMARLKHDAHDFNLAKITMIDEHLNELIRAADAYSIEVGKTVGDTCLRLISAIQYVAILDAHRYLLLEVSDDADRTHQ